MAKYKYKIAEVDKETALEMVLKYHYSDRLPKLNRHFLGFYLEEEIVGLVTLGWGTRPKHTIKKLFPMLDTNDYFEIGRMCMTNEMPKNSESQMLSQLIKWIRVNLPHIKVLFTWADGMNGKAGYVYQASNFLYAGHIISECYVKDGVKLHPRSTREIFGAGDKRLTVRPTFQQMLEHNIKHYKGKQFRYIYLLDNSLKDHCIVDLSYDYPKDKDLIWREKAKDGKWIDCKRPDYMTDINFKL